MGSGSSKAGGGRGKGKDSYLQEELKEHEGSINCLVLSEDCSLIVTGSDDATARMWSALTEPPECLGVLRGHQGRVTSAAMGGTYIFTGGIDTTIRKWDMCTSECLYTYKGHMQQINRLLCSGDFIISTSYDKTTRVWLMEADDAMSVDEVCLRVLEGHQRAVYPVVFIPGKDTGGLNEEGLRINPGDLLITGSMDTTARSWSLDMGMCLKVFRQHTGAVTCMDTDETGRFLYTGSHDCQVIIWNIIAGRSLKILDGHKDAITCLKVVNRLMYTGSADSTVKCWVREYGDCTRTYKQSNAEASVVCVSFHGGMVFVGYTDCTAKAFDAKSSSLKREFRGHTDAVNHLVVTAGRLYTTSSDGALRVWDASGMSNQITATRQDNSDLRDLDRELELELDQYLDENTGDLPGN